MRAGGDRRGNNRDRARRKRWLLATFDPDLGPDHARCRLMLSDRCRGVLDYASLTTDRIEVGGTYTRANCRPSCAPCQSLQGALVSQGAWVS